MPAGIGWRQGRSRAGLLPDGEREPTRAGNPAPLHAPPRTSRCSKKCSTRMPSTASSANGSQRRQSKRTTPFAVRNRSRFTNPARALGPQATLTRAPWGRRRRARVRRCAGPRVLTIPIMPTFNSRKCVTGMRAKISCPIRFLTLSIAILPRQHCPILAERPPIRNTKGSLPQN